MNDVNKNNSKKPLRYFKTFAYLMAFMFMVLGLTEVICGLPFTFSMIFGMITFAVGLIIDVMEEQRLIIEMLMKDDGENG
jgi:hypothetical protein